MAEPLAHVTFLKRVPCIVPLHQRALAVAVVPLIVPKGQSAVTWKVGATTVPPCASIDENRLPSGKSRLEGTRVSGTLLNRYLYTPVDGSMFLRIVGHKRSTVGMSLSDESVHRYFRTFHEFMNYRDGPLC